MSRRRQTCHAHSGGCPGGPPLARCHSTTPPSRAALHSCRPRPTTSTATKASPLVPLASHRSLARSRTLPSKTSTPSAPAAPHTRRPSEAAARCMHAAGSATLCGGVPCPLPLSRGSHTHRVPSSAALHTRHRSGLSPSGVHTGSTARSTEPPPGTERRQSVFRASHSRMPQSSAADSTIAAPCPGLDGGAPGVQMHESAPRWPVSTTRTCSSLALSTAIRPSAIPTQRYSSQPNPSAVTRREVCRSGAVGLTVSTRARQVACASSCADPSSSPEVVA